MKGERIRDRARSRSAHAFDNIVRCIAPTVPAMLSRAGQPRLPPIPHVRGYGAARHSARKQRTPVAASAEDPAAIPSLPGSRQRGDADYVTHRVAMSGQYCFVCASNEGIFLDVTPDNQSTFGDQIETCLSSKVRPARGCWASPFPFSCRERSILAARDMRLRSFPFFFF